MNSYRLVFIILALVVGAVSYLASNDLFIFIGVTLVYLIYPQLLLVNILIKSHQKYVRFNECFHFVNTFLISLKIKGSINDAFNNVGPSLSKEYQLLYDGIRDFSITEKISYLLKYFPFHYYSLFSKVINLWEEEGGDILEMSSSLLNEGRNSVELINHSHALSISKIVELFILWGLTLLILVISRFALNQFFVTISDKIIYKVGLVIFFIFLLISIDIGVRRVSKMDIKGWEEYE